MCTLTYLPWADGFAVASNRDESRARGGMRPPVFDAQRTALYPIDQHAGGTWLLTAPGRFTLNLMNGGHETHVRTPPYQHSRGIVPLRFVEDGSTENFLALRLRADRALYPGGLPSCSAQSGSDHMDRILGGSHELPCRPAAPVVLFHAVRRSRARHAAPVVRRGGGADGRIAKSGATDRIPQTRR
ncbi:MAG: NRDE family protein [Flavobacteriales bacterium]|nr:NRDE family protein [Flavobacteriales bacterium]